MRLTNYAKLARLHQPTGIWLLLLPCLMAIALIAKKLPQPDFEEILSIASLFAIGSLLMRSAGCIINDIFDHKFDQEVSRTKNRPLAAKIVSFEEALLLLGLLLLLSFTILLQFNNKTIASGFFGLFLAVLYPLTKRFTYFPQLFLGAAFNFGILMASLALIGDIGIETFTLYASCIVWTLLYDTVYAFQDIEDDLRIGVKSSAIAFSKKPKFFLKTLCLLMILGFFALGIFENYSVNYFLVIIVNSLLIMKKIIRLQLSNPKRCLNFFRLNVWFGAVFLLAIILG